MVIPLGHPSHHLNFLLHPRVLLFTNFSKPPLIFYNSNGHRMFIPFYINLEKTSRYFGALTSSFILQGRPIGSSFWNFGFNSCRNLPISCDFDQCGQLNQIVHQNPGYPLQLLSKSVLRNDCEAYSLGLSAS